MVFFAFEIGIYGVKTFDQRILRDYILLNMSANLKLNFSGE